MHLVSTFQRPRHKTISFLVLYLSFTKSPFPFECRTKRMIGQKRNWQIAQCRILFIFHFLPASQRVLPSLPSPHSKNTSCSYLHDTHWIGIAQSSRSLFEPMCVQRADANDITLAIWLPIRIESILSLWHSLRWSLQAFISRFGFNGRWKVGVLNSDGYGCDPYVSDTGVSFSFHCLSSSYLFIYTVHSVFLLVKWLLVEFPFPKIWLWLYLLLPYQILHQLAVSFFLPRSVKGDQAPLPIKHLTCNTASRFYKSWWYGTPIWFGRRIMHIRMHPYVGTSIIRCQSLIHIVLRISNVCVDVYTFISYHAGRRRYTDEIWWDRRTEALTGDISFWTFIILVRYHLSTFWPPLLHYDPDICQHRYSSTTKYNTCIKTSKPPSRYDFMYISYRSHDIHLRI